VLPNVSGLFSPSIPDSDALAEYLLREAHIGVTPGSGFGAPQHIRLSYATSMEAIRKGMDRLEAAAGKLTAAR
jgi:aspartate aminotransferase